MSENSKNDILLNDLTDIQSLVEVLIVKCRDLSDANEKLESQINILKKEKSELTQNILKLEEKNTAKKEKTDSAVLGNLNKTEKEELKNKISELISRIDFHLSGEPARHKLDEVDRQI